MTTTENTVSPFVDARALAEYFGVTVVTIRRWASSGTIPPGVRIGRRLVRWQLAEVEQHLHNSNRGIETRG